MKYFIHCWYSLQLLIYLITLYLVNWLIYESIRQYEAQGIPLPNMTLILLNFHQNILFFIFPICSIILIIFSWLKNYHLLNSIIIFLNLLVLIFVTLSLVLPYFIGEVHLLGTTFNNAMETTRNYNNV